MTAGRCTLVCCAFDRERANRAPGRRSLTPLYSPAAATRDAVAGDSTSSAVAGAPEPAVRLLGSQAALDTFPRSHRPGVPGLPASTRAVAARGSESRLVFPSKRMKRIDDFLDDLAFAAGWGVLGLLVLLVVFVVAVRVFGGAS